MYAAGKSVYDLKKKAVPISGLKVGAMKIESGCFLVADNILDSNLPLGVYFACSNVVVREALLIIPIALHLNGSE